jgi:hypothetical protein
MKTITIDNFIHLNSFDLDAAGHLSDFFDLGNDLQEDNLTRWMTNLRLVSAKNLGLAHCILHSETARMISTQIGIKRPFKESIGVYHIHNVSDGVVNDNNRFHGVVTWTSNLDNATFAAIQVQRQNPDRWIVVDQQYAKFREKIKLVGMTAADASSFIVDCTVPEQEIITFTSNKHRTQENKFVNSHPDVVKFMCFHKFGTITNHVGIISEIINYLQVTANEYDLNVITNEFQILESTWAQELKGFYKNDFGFYDKKLAFIYIFAKKLLVDAISIAVKTFNSRLYIKNSASANLIQDALVYSSHIRSLSNMFNSSYHG